MEETKTSSQSLAFLETLLAYVACPVDGSPLSASRNADGQIVALRSRNGKYPVVHNVPCLMPELADCAGRNLALWQAHQAQMWQDYQDGDPGVFSGENEITHYLGEIIAESGGGLFLDVGCGALASPGYMATAGSQTQWIGIDPFFGDVPRDFPFVQALGEYPPFQAGVFDGVLYASTIYHQYDPGQALERTLRVIKPNGRLYIWYEPPGSSARYVFWKIRRALGWPCDYSRSYRWAFTRNSLCSWLERTGWTVEDEVLLCVRCPEYGTCKEAGELLVIARRAP